MNGSVRATPALSSERLARTQSATFIGDASHQLPMLGFVSHNTTARSESGNSNGRNRTPSTTVKMAVVAPIPSAIVPMTAAAKVGAFASVRKANRTSCRTSIVLALETIPIAAEGQVACHRQRAPIALSPLVGVRLRDVGVHARTPGAHAANSRPKGRGFKSRPPPKTKGHRINSCGPFRFWAAFKRRRAAKAASAVGCHSSPSKVDDQRRPAITTSVRASSSWYVSSSTALPR